MRKLISALFFFGSLGILWISCDPSGGNSDASALDLINIQVGQESIIVVVEASEGSLLTVSAHLNQDFSDEGISVEASAEGSPQNIGILGLTGDTDYYIRVMKENSQSGETTTEPAPDNPYRTQAEPLDPSVSLSGLESGDRVILAAVTALPAITMTLSAHTDPDFSDPGVIQEILSNGSPETLVLRGLTNGVNYYLRARGENEAGDYSDWEEDANNPYLPALPDTYIADAVPRSTLITCTVETPDRVESTLELSLDADFSTVVHTEEIIGDGNTLMILLSQLTDDQAYYLRIKEDQKIHWESYVTPLIPAADGTQYIHRLSELAKIGVDTTNYPLDWTYELKWALNFADANNDSYEGDLFETDEDPGNGNWIGLAPVMTAPFTGTFDGGGLSITGMNVSGIVQSQGFFGYLGDGSVVKNLGIKDYILTSIRPIGGGLVGTAGAGSLIHSSYATGSLSIISQGGGLVGILDGTIENSWADVEITSGIIVGGLVGNGMIAGNVIRNSYALGDLIGSGGVKGGLAGQSLGTIINSYAAGDVLGDGLGKFGGVVGDFSGTISNSFALGNVSDNSDNSGVGGLVGNNNGTIVNSYRFAGQTVTNGDNTLGASVSSLELASSSWYTDVTKLNWGEGTPANAQWHITGPVGGGFLPRVNREGETEDAPASEVFDQSDTLLP